MKITIRTYEELIAFVNRDDISLANAYDAVIAYISPVIVFTGGNFEYNTKSELLADLDNYIEIEKNSIVPPLYLKQRKAAFSIRDIYNTDKNK